MKTWALRLGKLLKWLLCGVFGFGLALVATLAAAFFTATIIFAIGLQIPDYLGLLLEAIFALGGLILAGCLTYFANAIVMNIWTKRHDRWSFLDRTAAT